MIKSPKSKLEEEDFYNTFHTAIPEWKLKSQQTRWIVKQENPQPAARRWERPL